MAYMITQALLDFTATQLERGIKEDTIIEQLRSEGWSVDEAQKALESVRDRRDPSKRMLTDMAFGDRESYASVQATQSNDTSRKQATANLAWAGGSVSGSVMGQKSLTPPSPTLMRQGRGSDRDESEYSGLKVMLMLIALLGIVLIGIVVGVYYESIIGLLNI